MNINKKTFNLTTRIQKSFSIAMYGFQSATTLLFRIRDKIRLSFIATLASQIYTVISVKRIRLLISQVKLKTSITQLIDSRRISISYYLRQQMKSVAVIYGRIPITIVSKATQKVVTIFKTGILGIIADPTLASFFVLSVYDPQTLGDLDTKTLGEMDYTST